MLRLLQNAKIRMNSGNRFGKYLLYAIGEIVLVVIGILLAIQIDSWRDGMAGKRAELELLRGLREDLLVDTKMFGDLIFRDSIALEGRWTALEASDLGSMSNDSLWRLVFPVWRDTHLTERTFLKLVNGNFISQGDLYGLSDQVLNYYSKVKGDFEGYMGWDKTMSMEDSKFWRYNDEFEIFYLPLAPRQHPDTRRAKFIENLQSVRVRNLLQASAFRKNWRLRNLRATNQAAVELIRNIEAVLRREAVHFE